jgi:hypothetical protein
MSTLRLILSCFLIYQCSSTVTIIDTELDNENLLDCPIDRLNTAQPSILQWFRSNNNFTVPVASQFDDFPVHIDKPYQDRYSLLSNGSLKIISIQLTDNDTFECRLIQIDRGLLDTREIYRLLLRVNGKPARKRIVPSFQVHHHRL